MYNTTTERNKAIFEYYNKYKCTHETIALKFNLSRSTVSKILRSFGVTILIDDKIKDKICLEYIQEQKSSCFLSKKYNISVPTISKILKAKGFKTRLPEYRRRIYKLNENYFDTIDTPEKAYFLGFLYADGNSKNNIVSISLQEKDAYILEKFNKIIHPEGKPLAIIPPKNGSKRQIKFQINSKHIYKTLFTKGIVPNKTLTLEYPIWLNKELDSHFIRGYFDGDGCVMDNYNQINLVGTYSMMNSIKKILMEKASLNNVQLIKKDKVYYLHYGGSKNCIKFKKFLYKDANIYLIRKKQKFDNIKINKNCVILELKNNTPIDVFSSLKECSIKTGLSIQVICRNCRDLPTHTKRNFKYASSEEIEKYYINYLK